MSYISKRRCPAGHLNPGSGTTEFRNESTKNLSRHDTGYGSEEGGCGMEGAPRASWFDNHAEQPRKGHPYEKQGKNDIARG